MPASLALTISPLRTTYPDRYACEDTGAQMQTSGSSATAANLDDRHPYLEGLSTGGAGRQPIDHVAVSLSLSLSVSKAVSKSTCWHCTCLDAVLVAHSTCVVHGITTSACRS